ncbi:hypothetical protein Pelo_558 [Pelomyxa schiedti]|nr:hypothetical protein Pelo_558 [Pelomyxa schiedti]
MLPRWVLVECIGKRWVVAVDRVVVAAFFVRPRNAIRDYEVLFSVSHTLGIVQLPTDVIHYNTLGWIGPDRTLRLDPPAVPHAHWTFSIIDGPHLHGAVVMGPLQFPGNRQSHVSACNRRWIVMSQMVLCLLEVWKVVDGLPLPEPVVVNCSWMPCLQSLRFFSLRNEYDFESDTLEVFFLGHQQPGQRDSEVVLSGFHIDLNTVWKEGEIKDPVWVSTCNLTKAGISPDNLCTPLVDRTEMRYYLPFTETQKTSGKQSERLLDLRTGIAITWLEDNKELEVKAVDSSHVCTTTSDLSSTSVYSLSALCNLATTLTPKRRRVDQPHPQIAPCITHVVAGCGLLVSSTIVRAWMHSAEFDSFPERRLATVPYQGPWETILTSIHTFRDALTGASLFTMSLAQGIFPQLITPFPFKSPPDVTVPHTRAPQRVVVPRKLEEMVPGTLPSASHVVMARDQLVALLACVAFPRCGTRSPARLLPAHVVADEIGSRWVMHVDRRVAIMGDHLLPDPSVDHRNEMTRHFVFVDVSHTLGVVGRWACRKNAQFNWTCIHVTPAGLFGDKHAVVEGTRGGKIGIVNLVSREVRDVDDPGFVGAWTHRVSNGRKWVVIWEGVKSEHIVVLSVSAMKVLPQQQSQESERESYWRHVNVGRKAFLANVLMNTEDDDEGSFVVRDGSAAKLDMWRVDLKRSFESGELAVTGTFCGFSTLSETVCRAVYHSKEHNVILPLTNEDGTTTRWKAVSPSQSVILHTSHCPVDMVDPTHFAEGDRASETLTVFSTADFGHPVHVFPLRHNIKVLGGNGFIVLWDEDHFDVFDALTGTFLLHQPSHSAIHKRRSILNVNACNVAERQFLALASGRCAPPPPPSSPGGPTIPTRSRVWMLPRWVLVECIGKRWVMAVDRVVMAKFFPGPMSLATQGYEVLFSVSHTLGIVQPPTVVTHYNTLGWIGPDRTVYLDEPDDVPAPLWTFSILDGPHDTAVMGPLQFPANGQSQISACNRRWIVMSPTVPCLFEVWKVVDGLPLPEPVVVNCSWMRGLQSLRFFSLRNEYDFESDTLEVFFLEFQQAGQRDSEVVLLGFHIDLNTVWKEGEIKDPVWVSTCNLTKAGISPDNLCTPLVDRTEMRFYLTFTETQKPSGKQSERLLDLRTGISITWLEDNKELEVKAVDSSHVCTTTSDLSSTSVYSLSALCHPPSSCSTPKRRRVDQPHPQIAPCITHQHPEGTQSVVAGCGLLVSSTIVRVWVLSSEFGSFSERRLAKVPYQGPRETILRSIHTFRDALTGASLFTMSLAQGIFPQLITPFPFKSPRVSHTRFTSDYIAVPL